MTLEELDSFLHQVGAPSLEAYLGVPGADDAATALDEKMKWAAWHFKDPESGPEAEFVMAHALQLRAILDEGEDAWRRRQVATPDDAGGRVAWHTMPSFLTPGGAPGRTLGDGRTIVPPDGGIKDEALAGAEEIVDLEFIEADALEPVDEQPDAEADDAEEAPSLGEGRTLVPTGATPVMRPRDLEAPTLPSFDDFEDHTIAPTDAEPEPEEEPKAPAREPLADDHTLPTLGDPDDPSDADSTDPVGFTASELEPHAREVHAYTPSGRTRRTHSDKTYDFPPDPSAATGSHTWIDWDEVGERPTDPVGDGEVDPAEAPTVRLSAPSSGTSSNLASYFAIAVGIAILLLGALVLVVVILDLSHQQPVPPPAPELPLAIPAPLPAPVPEDTEAPEEPSDEPAGEAPAPDPRPVPITIAPGPAPRSAAPTRPPAPVEPQAPKRHPLVGTWSGATGSSPITLRVARVEGTSVEATVKTAVSGVPQTMFLSGTWDDGSSALALGSSEGPSFLGTLDDKGLRGTWSESAQGAPKQWFVVKQ